MTTTHGDERVVDIWVKKVASVASNKGDPQYEIHADGGQLFGSQYDFRFWVDVSKVPTPPLAGKVYRAVIKRGQGLKDKDPSKDYNFKWFVNRWGADDLEPTPHTAPAGGGFKEQAAHSGNQGGGSSWDEREVKINRSVVWKAALDYNIACGAELAGLGFVEQVTQTATVWLPFYEHFIATGGGEAAPTEPEAEAPATDGLPVSGEPAKWHIEPANVSDTLSQEQFGKMLVARGLDKDKIKDLLGMTGQEYATANKVSLKGLFLEIQSRWEAEESLPW